MTVYFCNREPIDLNAISIMGVSVKTGDTPIGYFGTGLKFAIATLLRSGCKIELTRDGQMIPFTVDQENIRGETFDRVVMGLEKLGFTTRLGRNWEPWQAYRELYSNCLDESGVITRDLPAGEWGTVFAVTGDAIELCHNERSKIFLDTAPLSVSSQCEIHRASGHFAFYRGVRAHQHHQHPLFTYNVLAKLELTEDRTVKYPVLIEHFAVSAIVTSDDENLIETALLAPSGTYEHQMDYITDAKPSLAFMDVAFKYRGNARCNQKALKIWERHADVSLTFEPVDLDIYEQEILAKATVLLHRIGAKLSAHDFVVVEGMGDSVFGCVRDGQILIAKRCFDVGHTFLASTIYEEWLHKTQGLRDESRDMQNLLFEKLFGMVERVTTMESRARIAA